jgi:hypothetical protein
VERTLSNDIPVAWTDAQVNSLLEKGGNGSGTFTRHFSQGEDFFLHFERPYTVRPLPVHHDVRLPQPSARYMESLRATIGEIVALAPQVLRDTTWFFDPGDIHRPSFFRIFRVEEALYLYLLRVDLMMRPGEGTAIERSVDDTPLYTTEKLFLEALVIPLDEVVRSEGKVQAFRVKQAVSQTWIGEQGRGYHLQGIWIDADLTKFFSKLFLPAGARTYPFYPYVCKFKTICQTVIDLGSEGRKSAIPHLHRAVRFLLPAMDRIQDEMKTGSFREDMKTFTELKARVPPSWYDVWAGVKLEAYLNAAERREYRVL